MHFDLTDLRLFLHVAEAGSITGGAACSGLALASASARVRGMEEQAGVALLERDRRGVRPTPAGRALLHHARAVMGQVERMRGELGEYAHGLKGHVRLLANTAAMAEHLPEALAAFLAENPNVDVDLDERPSADRRLHKCADPHAESTTAVLQRRLGSNVIPITAVPSGI